MIQLTGNQYVLDTYTTPPTLSIPSGELPELSVKQLFVTPLQDYDVVVRLHHGALPRYFESVLAPPTKRKKVKKYVA